MLERSSAEKRKVPPAFSVTLQETIVEAAPGSRAVRSMSQRLEGQLSAKLESSDLHSAGAWSRPCVRTQRHTLIEAIQPHGLLNVPGVCAHVGGGLPAFTCNVTPVPRLQRRH